MQGYVIQEKKYINKENAKKLHMWKCMLYSQDVHWQ